MVFNGVLMVFNGVLMVFNDGYIMLYLVGGLEHFLFSIYWE